MAISFKYRPIANPASYSNQEPHFKVLGLHCGRKSNLKPIILAIFLVQIANIFFFLVVAPWVAHQTHRRDKCKTLFMLLFAQLLLRKMLTIVMQTMISTSINLPKHSKTEIPYSISMIQPIPLLISSQVCLYRLNSNCNCN
jgi:hypothetical protein